MINLGFSDTFKHKGLRQKLVDELESKGIKDKNVLDAVNRVPRHIFMDSGFLQFSYRDQAFPIGAGQTISQPYTVAYQTEMLNLKAGEKVLEIGTGSGYQTAVLLEMGAKVFTIERQHELYLKSQHTLRLLNYNPHFFYGDGYLGKPSYGPYDKILITAGAPVLPEKLIEQLKPGGRMVAPIGKTDNQTMFLVEKSMENKIVITEHGSFVFVPMLTGTKK